MSNPNGPSTWWRWLFAAAAGLMSLGLLALFCLDIYWAARLFRDGYSSDFWKARHLAMTALGGLLLLAWAAAGITAAAARRSPKGDKVALAAVGSAMAATGLYWLLAAAASIAGQFIDR